MEIVTSKSAHGPSRDWMKIAKSSEARSKIRQWFKQERRDGEHRPAAVPPLRRR
ncbi:MAG: hypothetical protein ACLUNQ_03055 [Oscillospiraceae bacterium]